MSGKTWPPTPEPPVLAPVPLRDVLPQDVCWAETPVPMPRHPALLPAEEAAAAGSYPDRYQDFIAGRGCAHRAMAGLGVVGARRLPVLRGDHREPLWPRGVVGSITHRAGYCAAAVARRRRFAGIGIDAELAEPLPAEVVRDICTPAERAWLRAHTDDGIPWETVLFSAKESLYKAWFPLAGSWLDHRDAELIPDPADRTLRVRLAAPHRERLARYGTPHCTFAVRGSYIATCVTFPAREGRYSR
ncbi:4'-phosphopantetheinyl transferase superfamily protein [Streptomyces sp. YC504]|uniref:4'-phosphopantetheinyl transferase superfamily protein n=1 Tax=Streptomyces mesophilus TaxID=1775132 RepID=A0A6G4XGK8_9ACTN|nr:4'-phosphopantetheinyl transferase superfamily protein [Streptomyces mesophilus]NGO75980.1 4'-phosphopantetheinyl transferase superfamily protein [Streptomyces mesophilus]